MIINKAMHLKDDVDKKYIKRKESWREQSEEGIKSTIKKLEDYIRKSKERVITTAKISRRIENWKKNRETENLKTRIQKFRNRKFYEYFKRQIKEITNEITKTWLQKEKQNHCK